VFSEAGVTEHFPAHVYHAIHSITLNDLKMFEPTVTENNLVPTINKDKTSANRVLLNAPDIKSKNEAQFKTDAMKILDLILSDIDQKRYYQNEYSVLEEIVHTAHMREFWANVLVEYKKIQSSVHNDKPICSCVLDIESNGVMDVFRTVANASAQFESKHSPLCEDTLRYKKLDGHINYCALERQKRGIIGTSFCLKTTGDKSRDQRLKVGQCSVPTQEELHLLGADAWSLYVKRLPCLEKDIYEPALYLYCALKPKVQ